MTAIQLFNEILFIVTFVMLIIALAILSIVAILRERREGRGYQMLHQRLDALEKAKP